MKKIITAIIYTFLCFALNGQETTFYKYYDVDNVENSGFRFNVLANGYLFTSPYACPNPSDISCERLIRTDFNGEVISTLDYPNFLGNSDLYFDTVHNFIYEGGSFYDIGNGLYTEWGLSFRKRHADGKLIWERKYNSTTIDFVSHITPMPDGGFLLFGSGGTYDSASVTVLIRTDSLGNMLWTHDYNSQYQWNFAVAPAQLMGNGNIALFSTCRFLNQTPGSAACVMQVDSTNGAVLWSEYQYTYKDNQTLGGSVLKNDNLVFVRYQDSTGVPGCGLRLTCYKPNGAFHWEWLAPAGTCLEISWTEATNDGGLVAAFRGFTNDRISGGLLKLDSLGILQWKRLYVTDPDREDTWLVINAVRQTADSGYIMCGGEVRVGQPDMDAVLIKVDDGNGCLTPGCPVDAVVLVDAYEPGKPAAVPLLELYPNPAGASFTVTLPEPLPAGATLLLTDALCRQALRQPVTAATTAIPAGHLPRGLYGVVVLGENGVVLGRGKVVLE